MCGHMNTLVATAPIAFTPAERGYIRRELDTFFSTLSSVAEGLCLRVWRGGPQAGQPKVPKAATGLPERELTRLDATGRQPRSFINDIRGLWRI